MHQALASCINMPGDHVMAFLWVPSHSELFVSQSTLCELQIYKVTTASPTCIHCQGKECDLSF